MCDTTRSYVRHDSCICATRVVHKLSSGLYANELTQMRCHEWNVCEWMVTNEMSRTKCVWMSCHTVYFTNEIYANELSWGICHKRNVCEWVVTNEMSRMKCVWMSCHEVYVTKEMCANEWSRMRCHERNVCEWLVTQDMSQMCANEWSRMRCHERNVCEWLVTQDMSQKKCATRVVHMFDVTRAYVGYDSFIRATWLSYVRNDLFICAIWLVHMCSMTRSYVGYDSFVRATWLLYVRHDSFMCVPSICAVTQSYVPWLHNSDMTYSRVWWLVFTGKKCALGSISPV